MQEDSKGEISYFRTCGHNTLTTLGVQVVKCAWYALMPK